MSAPAAPATPGSRPVRLGLIGHGKLGAVHARHIAACPDTELAAVCDSEPAALVTAAEHGVPVTTDLDGFLAMPFDGVVIASSTQAHAGHILAAARAGKAIFVEKPVCLTLQDTDRVLQEVVDAGVPFQIGFQRRWDSRYLHAKRIIDSGGIGEPVLFKTHGRDPDASNPANWGLDRNGGLFLNCAIHDFDAARFLLGREVRAVTATGAALVHKGLRDKGDIDTCSATLHLDGDTMALTEWSRYATYGYDIAMEVVGTEGMVQFGRERGEAVLVRPSTRDGASVFDVFGDAYRDSVEAFAASIAGGTPTSPGVEDARTALHIALAARRSFETGRSVPVKALPPLTRGGAAVPAPRGARPPEVLARRQDGQAGNGAYPRPDDGRTAVPLTDGGG
ncbi:Gfo/Idh/MocA family protein [Actinomadura decatromicini]|uniref:Inositol 2-dehydrogenase n=1 Tax=Actinomadura decatromicini TaxID=2604572 RepID=A0A5D3FY56_9ACTN|nr:Gfo/Idh/MocA family oxidoreductase [Actinomadura decatromicini]TYK53104.1 inositol 2-dehydrogenase [Actinomadura decatromicini]